MSVFNGMLPHVMTVTVLVPAAGSGERLGLGPKAFLPLGDTTILGQTLRAFAGMSVVVAVSKDMLPEAESYETDKVKLIVGADTRQETVMRLLKATNSELVLIHDAARPFLKFEVIEKSIVAARIHGAASVVKKVADTFVSLDGATVDRDALRAVQTPQTFKRALLVKAHRHAAENNLQATDDAALVRGLGHEVKLIEGDTWLDKITTPADYARAQALIPIWRNHET